VFTLHFGFKLISPPRKWDSGIDLGVSDEFSISPCEPLTLCRWYINDLVLCFVHSMHQRQRQSSSTCNWLKKLESDVDERARRWREAALWDITFHIKNTNYLQFIQVRLFDWSAITILVSGPIVFEHKYNSWVFPAEWNIEYKKNANNNSALYNCDLHFIIFDWLYLPNFRAPYPSIDVWSSFFHYVPFLYWCKGAIPYDWYILLNRFSYRTILPSHGDDNNQACYFGNGYMCIIELILIARSRTQTARFTVKIGGLTPEELEQQDLLILLSILNLILVWLDNNTSQPRHQLAHFPENKTVPKNKGTH